jgi:hypothetical protein
MPLASRYLLEPFRNNFIFAPMNWLYLRIWKVEYIK